MMPPVAILAGGLATRLYPLTKTIPKALLDINGKPFIFHQLQLLQREGISDVVLCVGYLGEKIQDVVRDGSEFALNVRYSYDGDKLLGTGGSLRKALPLLGNVFWVLYGDSYLDTRYAPVLDYFIGEKKFGLMTVFKNDGKWDTSNVIFRDGIIIKYSKTDLTADMQYIDYGLSLFRKETFQDIPEDTVIDLFEIFQGLIRQDELLGYEVKERFYEIGSDNGIDELRKLLP